MRETHRGPTDYHPRSHNCNSFCSWQIFWVSVCPLIRLIGRVGGLHPWPPGVLWLVVSQRGTTGVGAWRVCCEV